MKKSEISQSQMYVFHSKIYLNLKTVFSRPTLAGVLRNTGEWASQGHNSPAFSDTFFFLNIIFKADDTLAAIGFGTKHTL